MFAEMRMLVVLLRNAAFQLIYGTFHSHYSKKHVHLHLERMKDDLKCQVGANCEESQSDVDERAVDQLDGNDVNRNDAMQTVTLDEQNRFSHNEIIN